MENTKKSSKTFHTEKSYKIIYLPFTHVKTGPEHTTFKTE